MEKHGVVLVLDDGASEFRHSANGSLEVLTEFGRVFAADIVILAIGVRPETGLAKNAGLEIGERGGIRVDDQMRTSDPDIFAVGDAIEVKDVVSDEWSHIPLAGPANRQGRIAADVIAGRDARFRGVQGTSIIGRSLGRRRRGRASAKRRSCVWARPITKRSTSTRIRMRAIIRAPITSR